ncbi:hypothetical protein FDJ19_gp113 [Vibrio phage Ceto]|uniref:Uncharacterized protein n=1 Tax=Vibrio phage Ceto TaxID=2570300 RepID=A0A2H5BGR9_9CAUD|nr:hypothetical protein FDJ19_gp113 [Vibrio phage Ceto]AUG85185.1 hypothetical protein CETO_203 [Vibrio phage Ceto]
MKFKYLGDTYTIPESTYNFCKQRNLVRKLFSDAIPTNPDYSAKRYHLQIVSYYEDSDDLRWCVIYSQNKNYYKRFTDTVRHFSIPNLTKKQCQYLKTKLEKLPDFRQAITLAKEEIKVFS